MPWRKPPEPPLDPFERAARRVDPEYARLAEAADAVPPKNLRATRVLVGFALVVALVALASGGRGGASLTRSCTTPAVKVEPLSASYDTPISWAVTGPADLRAVLALDSTTVPASPLAGPVALHDCVARSTFPLQASKGEHTVTVFLLAADGTVRTTFTRRLEVL